MLVLLSDDVSQIQPSLTWSLGAAELRTLLRDRRGHCPLSGMVLSAPLVVCGANCLRIEREDVIVVSLALVIAFINLQGAPCANFCNFVR